jgi:hypothetical protein
VRCYCAQCTPQNVFNMRMILCETCGNKRCPHATDHRNACTDSNDPGQPGSAYADVKPVERVERLWPSHRDYHLAEHRLAEDGA